MGLTISPYPQKSPIRAEGRRQNDACGGKMEKLYGILSKMKMTKSKIFILFLP